MGNNLSVYYHPNAQFGIGASLTGNWNVAGHGEGSTLALLRFGARGYLNELGNSLVAEAAALVSFGGPETGRGFGLGLGYRMSLSRSIAVTPMLRVDAVTPDRASDGIEAGAGFDLLANLGLELSIKLPGQRPAPSPPVRTPTPFRPPITEAVDDQPETELSPSEAAAQMAVQIDSIYGRRNLIVGEEENYRVRTAPHPAWPIQYRWDMGDGVNALGNNIVHAFSDPGYYMVKVVAFNQFGSDSTWAIVQVSPDYGSEQYIVGNPNRRDRGARPATPETQDNTRKETPREQTQGNRRAPIVVDTENRTFAWVIESHTSRAQADRAVRRYAGRGLADLRVVVDNTGPGSVAYRVVVGNYTSTQQAVTERAIVESKSQKSSWLLTIEH